MARKGNLAATPDPILKIALTVPVSLKALDPFMAVLRELIDDHPTRDIPIDVNLVVMHHAANVSAQPCS